MFTINRSQGCYLEKFSITARLSNPLLEGVRIEQGILDDANPKHWPGLTSSLNTVRDVAFRGQARLGTCVRVRLYDHGNDEKNDHHRFERLQCSGYTYAAFVLEGRNAKAITLDQVQTTSTVRPQEDTGETRRGYWGVLTIANASPMQINADGTVPLREDGTMLAIGDPRVDSGDVVYNKGASFFVQGGQFAGNRGANFAIGDRNDALVISGAYSEKSARMLWVPDYPAGVEGGVGAFPVVVIGGRFSSIGDNVPADREAIQFDADTGLLTLIGFRLGHRVAGEQFRIRCKAVLVMYGCEVSNDGDGNVFTGQVPRNADYTTATFGYRAGKDTDLGLGVVIPTDGPAGRKYPRTSGQWMVLDGTNNAPVPDSKYRGDVAATPAWAALTEYAVDDRVTNGGNVYECIKRGTSDGSGGPTGTESSIVDGSVTRGFLGVGTGAIPDLFGSHPLIATGTLQYQQALPAGFMRSGIHFTQSSDEERLSPDTNDYNPATTSVAWWGEFQVIGAGGNRVLISLGNGEQGAGSGAVQVKIQPNGRAHLFVDGLVRATGTFRYQGTGSVHRFLVVLDRQQGAASPRTVVYLFTDQEMLWFDATGLAIVNDASKCFGANIGLPPNCIFVDGAIWKGQLEIDRILSAGWRSAFGVVSYRAQVIAAVEFQNDSAGGGVLAQNQEWSVTHVAQLHASVRLRVGSRIKTIVFHVDRGGGGTITGYLKKRTAGTVTTTIYTHTINTGSGWTASATSPIDYIVEADHQVFISVQLDSGSQRLSHVVINYE
jgi:hypothetical protein